MWVIRILFTTLHSLALVKEESMLLLPSHVLDRTLNLLFSSEFTRILSFSFRRSNYMILLPPLDFHWLTWALILQFCQLRCFLCQSIQKIFHSIMIVRSDIAPNSNLIRNMWFFEFTKFFSRIQPYYFKDCDAKDKFAQTREVTNLFAL